jgi:5-carboxymethyl-2-hydroxymuconate isomerase
MWRRIDQFVFQPLVVAFTTVMREVIGERPPKVAFTEWQHATEAFLSDRAYEALRISIGVSRQLHRQRAVRRKLFELLIPSIRCVGGPSN